MSKSEVKKHHAAVQRDYDKKTNEYLKMSKSVLADRLYRMTSMRDFYRTGLRETFGRPPVRSFRRKIEDAVAAWRGRALIFGKQ